MALCGDSGGRRLETGEPCQQDVREAGMRCSWHPADVTPEEAVARRSQVARWGGIAAHLPHVLPTDTEPAVLADPESCRRVLVDTIGHVRTGLLDPQRGAVVVNAVRAAIEIGQLEISAKVAQLERLLNRRSA